MARQNTKSEKLNVYLPEIEDLADPTYVEMWRLVEDQYSQRDRDIVNERIRIAQRVN
jgi:hypothetical protein